MASEKTASLSGDVVVITGGSRGLGRATAEAFAARGARVVVNYRSNETAACDVVESIEHSYEAGEAIAVQADISTPADIDELFETIEEEYGSVDVLVHNAAVTAFKPLTEVTPKDIDLTYDLSVTGFLLATQRAVELMDDGGRIVAISGNDSHTCLPLHGLLGSAKAALECLVQYLAIELAENDIAVNAVNPGPLDKDNYYTSVSEETAAAMQDLSERMPKDKTVPLSAVADGIVMLSEPGREWITGEVLQVDGGLRLV